MILHIFSDSHSSAEISHWNKINNLQILTHQIEKFGILNLHDFDVHDGEAVCFCFCEIDSHDKKSIERTIANYLRMIQVSVKQFSIITIVYNIPHVERMASYTNELFRILCGAYGYLFLDRQSNDVTIWMNVNLMPYLSQV